MGEGQAREDLRNERRVTKSGIRWSRHSLQRFTERINGGHPISIDAMERWLEKFIDRAKVVYRDESKTIIRDDFVQMYFNTKTMTVITFVTEETSRKRREIGRQKSIKKRHAAKTEHKLTQRAMRETENEDD